MNGSMILPGTFGRHYRVFGGPYRRIPEGMAGVKMAAEIEAPFEVSVPTKDFQVPSVDLATVGLERTVALILQGRPVYVGCMGGIGRTGFFLALIAKAWGIDSPVQYVRANYLSHAVETPEQKKYVAEFPISSELTSRVFWGKAMNFRFSKSLTFDEDKYQEMVPSYQ